MNADTMRIHVSGEVEGTPFQVVSYTDNSWSGYRWRVPRNPTRTSKRAVGRRGRYIPKTRGDTYIPRNPEEI